MARNRFFVPEISEEVSLTGEEFVHAKSVLRLREGSEVTLFDGSGREFSAVVCGVLPREMKLHVLSSGMSEKDPKARVLLMIGALKGDKTELVVQKATELGVEGIVVFRSRYCSAYINENKLERLNRVSREAAKQCLRATVPPVSYAQTLEEAFGRAEGYENKLFACEFLTEGKSLSRLSGSCALVVGSEGGFSHEEFEEAKGAGFSGICLGKRILRAETAAIAALSVVLYELGELR